MKRWPTALAVGFFASVLWGVVVALYAAAPVGKDGPSRFCQWWTSSPNEFGDALAGIFAPLAFLWLVVATFLQKEELQHSTKALNIQAEELRQSVEQLTKQTQLREAEAQTAERASTIATFERGYDELIETLLLGIGAIGQHRLQGVSFHFSTVGELREANQKEGTAGLLNRLNRQIERVRAQLGKEFDKYCLEKAESRIRISSFVVDFQSWSNGVHHHRLFDLDRRASSDGMVRMHTTLSEILQSLLPADDDSR